MAVKLWMFALRSRRSSGRCKTAEAMRILATGRWARDLPHVKSGGGRRWIQLLQIRRLESVEDTVRAHVAMRREAVGHWGRCCTHFRCRGGQDYSLWDDGRALR